MRAFARSGRSRARIRKRTPLASLTALVVAGSLAPAGSADAADHGAAVPRALGARAFQSLDGTGNNRRHPDWGSTDIIYPRVAPARYADGIGELVDAPNPRYISNRIINDIDQPLYSRRGVSQWGFAWGQFLDHTFALRLGRRQSGEPGEVENIPFDTDDPLESFPNDLGFLFFERSVPADGTGETKPREHINLNSSYIDAFAVYGGTEERLEWMREGDVDGDTTDNGPRLLMPGGYLPRRDSRGDADSAPNMVVGGHLAATPDRAAVAGDIRANENPSLTATQTLFAREHNRIAAKLPKRLPKELRFQIARAVVIAEQQYITYNEFLPAMGMRLPRYTGYKRDVNATLTNEFATVAYRAHSMIRGQFKINTNAGRYSQETLDALAEMDIDIKKDGDEVELTIPLGEDAFFNPDLLEMVELGPMLKSLGDRPQSNNDEQIDNLLRSFPFQLPVEENPACEPDLPKCDDGVNDLASVDIARGRDHGMPSYNELREAYGLPPKTSFKAITGEDSEEFPTDPELTPGDEINDPDSLDFTALFDADGNPTTPEADDATTGERRTPLAARLKAVYGDVDKVDAFIGMIAEPHLRGREFGETQHAVWKREFTALRDGDRFFYARNPILRLVRRAFGIDYRKTLGEIIALNTDVPRDQLQRNVFLTSR